MANETEYIFGTDFVDVIFNGKYNRIKNIGNILLSC